MRKKGFYLFFAYAVENEAGQKKGRDPELLPDIYGCTPDLLGLEKGFFESLAECIGAITQTATPKTGVMFID